jgi:hypothetical protein
VVAALDSGFRRNDEKRGSGGLPQTELRTIFRLNDR